MSAAEGRDDHLDALKGFLVMVMVAYHAMNYFSSASAQAYGYLRFVNGSFVFLSGFAIAYLQAGRSANASTPLNASRLLWRGLRLLLLFTALNLLLGAFGLTSYRNARFGVESFVADAWHVYGVGDSNAMAFRILVPIAYTVMLAPLLLSGARWRGALAIIVFVLAGIYTTTGWPFAPNVFFLLIGLVGVSCGALTGPWMADSPPSPWPVIVLGAGACVLLMNWLSGNVLAYCLGIAALLKCVYDASRHVGSNNTFSRMLMQTGKYSLLCYVAQIALLHLLRLALRQTQFEMTHDLLLASLLTAAAMVLLSNIVAHLRQRSRWANTAYRAVFG
jgi:peptidoglycan/LPS O-acetylase OafA/YrhL